MKSRSRGCCKAERVGFEPTVPCRTLVFETGDDSSERVETPQVTESAADVLPAGLPESLETDADLRRLVDRWDTLPDAIRKAICALAEID
jgi:hypothetical protein